MAQGVLSYMNSTSQLRLRLGGTATEEFQALLPPFISPADQLIAFSDASWGSERPNIAGVLTLYGTPIHWFSKRSTSTGQSSAEQELAAAVKTAIEVVSSREVYAFLSGISLAASSYPTPLLTDNKAVALLADGDGSIKKMKHCTRHIAFLRELSDAKTILTAWVSTVHCLADSLTKPMTNIPYHTWRRLLVA